MKDTRKRQGSATTAITLRPEVPLLVYYERVAERANRMRLEKGLRGNVTVQQVILHRLRTLPAYQSSLGSGSEEG